MLEVLRDLRLLVLARRLVAKHDDDVVVLVEHEGGVQAIDRLVGPHGLKHRAIDTGLGVPEPLQEDVPAHPIT